MPQVSGLPQVDDRFFTASKHVPAQKKLCAGGYQRFRPDIEVVRWSVLEIKVVRWSVWISKLCAGQSFSAQNGYRSCELRRFGDQSCESKL
jgi:hypothetical protein